MYKHLSFEKWDCLLNKRKNYRAAVRGKNMICEIGFNAGHSLLAMILVNPNAQYVLFDLGVHKYSKVCFNYLKRKFPKIKMEIYWGDSRETLSTYQIKNPRVKFDMIHIDGCHKQEVYSVDWKNSLRVSSPGSLLIFDDTDDNKINYFIDTEIGKGVVREAEGFLQTFGYEHRILVRL